MQFMVVELFVSLGDILLTRIFTCDIRLGVCVHLKISYQKNK